MIIDKGLYGLRSSSARFHEHLAEMLRQMGYSPCKADTDFCVKDCGDHDEYVATYVDDVLAFRRDPLSTIEELKRSYVLKGIGKPEYYLGGNVVELSPEWATKGIHNGLSAETYIGNVIKKFEDLTKRTFRLYKTPMMEDLHPELDGSPFLNEHDHTLFRALIGSANLMILLGRLDIT